MVPGSKPKRSTRIRSLIYDLSRGFRQNLGVSQPQSQESGAQAGPSLAPAACRVLGTIPESSIARTQNYSRESTDDQLGVLDAGPVISPPISLMSNTTGPLEVQVCKNAAWRALESTLGTLRGGTTLFPPLQEAISSLISVLGMFEEAARHRQDYNELATVLKFTIDSLMHHLGDSPFEQVTAGMIHIIQAINGEITLVSNQRDRRTREHVFGPSGEGENLIRQYRRIEQLFHRLQVETSMYAWSIANKHLANTRLEGMGPAKMAPYNSQLSTDINRRTCTENTRKTVLLDLNTWSDDPNGKKIYWMDGMAGTGKTTIACSLSKDLESRGQLAASFFCTRTSPECRDANRIVPTIAYQLALHSTPFQSALCRTLDKQPDIGTRNIVTQFEQLLKEPLEEVKEKMPNNLVVVVDALDECENSHVVQLVLDLLFRYAASLPVKFLVTSRPEPGIREKIMREDQGSRSILHLHEIEKSLVQDDIELYLKEELAFMSLPSASIRQLAQLAGKLFIYAATAVRYIRPGNKHVDHQERLKTMLSVHSDSRKRFADIDALYFVVLTAVLDDKDLEPEERAQIQLTLWTVVCAQEPIPIDTLTALTGMSDKSRVAISLEPLRSVLHVSETSGLTSTLHASFPDFMFSKERSGPFFCDEKAHSQFLAHRCFEVMKGGLRFNICHLHSSFLPDSDVPDLEERTKDHISPSLSYSCRYWPDHLKSATFSLELCLAVDDFLSHWLLFWMEVMNLKMRMAIGAIGLMQAETWLRVANAPSDLLKLASDAYRFAIGFTAHAISLSTPHIYISALPLAADSSAISMLYRPRMRGLMNVKGTAIAQMGRAALATWTCHEEIQSVAYSPDGDRIVVGITGGWIGVRDVYDGKYITGPLKAHTSTVWCVAFSPDGSRIVSGSSDQTICIRDAYDGTLVVAPLKEHSESVLSVSYSPDSTRIASSSYDCTICVWDASSGTPVIGRFTGHTGPVRSVTFSPDGTRIASGSDDRTVCMWDARDGSLLTRLEGHTGWVWSVSFSPDGGRLASGSVDRAIRIWNTHDGTPISGPLTGHTSPVVSVKFSPNGTHVASGSHDNTIRVWDLRVASTTSLIIQGHTDWVRSVSFSPDGSRIVSCSDDRTVRLWSAHGGLSISDLPQVPGDGGKFLGFSPDGTFIFFPRMNYSVIRLWNAHNRTLVTLQNSRYIRIFVSAGFSPNGSLLAIGTASLIHIWDARSGVLVVEPFTRHKGPVKAVAFSPDGMRLVSGSEDRTICVWDILNATLLSGPLKGHTGPIVSVAFSPDSSKIVSGSNDRTVRLWNAHDGVPIIPPFEGHTRRVTSVAFSPNGAQVASGSHDRTICVWNIREGKLITKLFKGHTTAIRSIAFSPDGTHIVSSFDDYTIRVWNVLGATMVAGPFKFEGYGNLVAPVAFSPDGAHIVSGYENLVLRAWDTQPMIQIPAVLAGSWVVRNDGWILNHNSELLFWVPVELRAQLPRINNPFTTSPQGTLQINYSDIFCGEYWDSCYIGL